MTKLLNACACWIPIVWFSQLGFRFERYRSLWISFTSVPPYEVAVGDHHSISTLFFGVHVGGESSPMATLTTAGVPSACGSLAPVATEL